MYFFNHVASEVYDYLFKIELLWSCAPSSSLCYLRYVSGYKEIKIEIEGKGILGTIPFKSALPSILLKTMKN